MKRKILAIIVVLCLCATLTPISLAAGLTIYVSANATQNNGDGSEANPYTLLEALRAAEGDKSITGIEVADGIYETNSDWPFYLVPGVRIYAKNTGQATLKGNNVNNVICNYNKYKDMAGGSLEGFVITGGSTGNINGVPNYGGGIFFDASNAKFIDLIIEGNESKYGGGVWLQESQGVTMSNVTIRNNTATSDAGGIALYGTSITASDVIVSNNTAGTSSSEGWGGGIYSDNSSNTFENLTVSNNTAGIAGGGISSYGGDKSVYNNLVLQNNSSGGDGGGLHNDLSSTITVNRGLFTGNTAALSGGAIFEGGASDSKYCEITIADNQASNGGGIYLDNTSSATFDKTIVWANKATTAGTESLFDDAGAITFTDSDVQVSDPDKPIPGTFSKDPLFDGTYHLLYDSPAEGIGYYPDALSTPPVTPPTTPTTPTYPTYPTYPTTPTTPTDPTAPPPVVERTEIPQPESSTDTPNQGRLAGNAFYVPSYVPPATTPTVPDTTQQPQSGTTTVELQQPASASKTPLKVDDKSVYGVKTLEVAPIYERASTKSSKILTAHKDAALVVVGGKIKSSTGEYWRRVIVDGKFGFIRDELLQPWSEEKSSLTLLATIYDNAGFGKMIKSVRVWDKTTTDRKEIGVVTKDTIVATFGTKGSFTLIQCGKIKGYVQTSAISELEVSDIDF